jgi:hypothetical protein
LKSCGRRDGIVVADAGFSEFSEWSITLLPPPSIQDRADVEREIHRLHAQDGEDGKRAIMAESLRIIVRRTRFPSGDFPRLFWKIRSRIQARDA